MRKGEVVGSRISGFYKKSLDERLEIIKKEANLSDEEVQLLKKEGPLPLITADAMVENVIGTIALPLGIATNFKVNGKEYLVPMAIEEPSVIAAASNAAKLSLPEGFTASYSGSIMTGQVQLIAEDVEECKSKLLSNKNIIEAFAKESSKHMEKYGGGFVSFDVKGYDRMVVCYFDVNVGDAMGANTINTIMEKIAVKLEEITNCPARARILTNLCIKRMVESKAVWKKSVLGKETISNFLEVYELAKKDIFRATTNNKGIMNGIDAVAIATGNDWRAIESGVHAYASLHGYKPLAHYELDDGGNLVGKIKLPLAVGIVGGTIKSNPIAQISLKILNVSSAGELAMVMASVGLSNNFAAIRAIANEGIQRGHMKLHARHIAMKAGAKGEEINKVISILMEEKDFSEEKAKKILEELRKGMIS